MSRLIHSFGGMMRAFEMSSCTLFGLVEGISADPRFLGELLRATPITSSIKWSIHRSHELTNGAGGGKTQLLEFYNFLKGHNKLFSTLGGKKTVVFLFLDKDVDDLCGKAIADDHLVYSKSYNLEAELYTYGDVVKAAGATASLEHHLVETAIVSKTSWIEYAAKRLREWIAICLFVKRHGFGCSCGYGRFTTIHDAKNLALDPVKHRNALSEIERISAMNSGDFKAAFSDCLAFVDRAIAASETHTIVNGKWYGQVLFLDLKNKLAAHPFDEMQFAQRMISSLLISTDFAADWSEDYRKKLGALASRAL